jgi:hypothetical protein
LRRRERRISTHRVDVIIARSLWGCRFIISPDGDGKQVLHVGAIFLLFFETEKGFPSHLS